MKTIPLFFAISAIALLSACGQTGGLYLPKDKPEKTQAQNLAPANSPVDVTAGESK